MKKIGSFLSTVLVAGALAACSSTPVGTDGSSTRPAAPQAGTQAPAGPAASSAAAPAAGVTTAALPAHKDPKSAISRERSIYFDYDDFSIKGEYQGVIVNHGKYLQANPGLAVRIEGHADERGSAEYNLALGQKRAEAIMRALKLYGVKDSQMEAVSFGEERPQATGGDEAAWSRNRRGDVTYRN